jgi:hypothetical protein
VEDLEWYEMRKIEPKEYSKTSIIETEIIKRKEFHRFV